MAPIRALSYYYIGNDLKRQGRLILAEMAYKQVVKIFPHLFLAWSNLGTVLIDQVKPSEALIACEVAVTIAPEFWHAYQGIGNAYMLQGQWEKAEEAFQKVITLFQEGKTYPKAIIPSAKSIGSILSNLGIVQMNQGRCISAVSSFRQAILETPKDARAWNNLAVGLREIGLLKEAVASLHRAIECNPGDWQPSKNLISYYLEIGDISTAAKELRRYLVFQLQRARVTPLWVARDFGYFNYGNFLDYYDLLAQSDSEDKPPGCGEHILDRYLTIVQQVIATNFKNNEFKPGEVIGSLLRIALLWCWCAQRLPEKGLSKQVARSLSE